MLQTKVVGKNKTRSLCSVTFFRKSCCLWNNLWEYCRAGQATDDNVAHAHYCNLRPLAKGQESLSLEDGTDSLPRNVGKKLTTTRCVTTQKSAVLIHVAAEDWNHAEYKPGLCPWRLLVRYRIYHSFPVALASTLRCSLCTLCVCLRLM